MTEIEKIRANNLAVLESAVAVLNNIRPGDKVIRAERFAAISTQLAEWRNMLNALLEVQDVDGK